MTPSLTCVQDGFIHLTADPSLLLEVANRFYTKSQGDWEVLVIDSARLTAEVSDVKCYLYTGPCHTHEAPFEAQLQHMQLNCGSGQLFPAAVTVAFDSSWTFDFLHDRSNSKLRHQLATQQRGPVMTASGHTCMARSIMMQCCSGCRCAAMLGAASSALTISIMYRPHGRLHELHSRGVLRMGSQLHTLKLPV
jgi:Protein of unknown function (DUF952)